MTASLRSIVLAASAMMLAPTSISSAFAQAANSPNDTTASADTAGSTDITVTGLRQQYRGDVPLKELPQSIQTLSGDMLREVGVTRLDAALDFASSVSRPNNFGGLFDAFALRGLAGDENTASNYLLNGFNASRGYGGIRDTSNVERIDILKGPSSALFGRGEPGGTINIITKKPKYGTVAGSVTLGYGSYDKFRGEGDINMPLASNVAFRVTGAYEEGDSFRDFVHAKKYTATPSILAQLASRTTLSYELEYVRQEVPFDRGIVAINGKAKGLPRSRFLGEPGDGDTRVNALGHQAQLQHNFSRDWSVLIGVGYRDTTFKAFSSDAELADARQPFYDNSSFTTGPILSRQRRFRLYGTRDLVFRGEVSGKLHTGSLVHHLLIGADWDYYQLDTVQLRVRPAATANSLTAASSQAALNAAHAINVFNPVYGDMPPVGPFTNQQEEQYSWGVYFQDQIDLTDALKLRLGGRYDDLEQGIAFRLPIAGTNTLPPRSKQNKTRFSPQIGLAYVVSDALTLYGSYGKGFRANTGTGAPDAAGISPLFDPEITKSYEVGAKFALLDEMVTGTFAAFKTKKNNVLTADPLAPGFSRALGKAQSQGIEFEANGALPAGFRISLAYSYLDAEVGENAADPSFGFTLLKGDPLVNIPKHSGSVLLFKDFSCDNSKLTLGAGVNHVGKRLGETGYRFPGGSFFTLPSYTLARVMASFEPTQHLRFSGEVTNLFDETYFPSSYSRLWLTPGAPRQFMVRAGYRL